MLTPRENPHKKLRNLGFFALFCGFALSSLSCVSRGDSFWSIDGAVNQNQFEAAVVEIKRAQKERIPLYPERNAVSLFLDLGMLEHYAGNYQASLEHLLEAERLIEEAFTRSITENITSFIANDNTKTYPGEDFEDIYLSAFNALNFYNNHDLEGALVEVRKITIPNGKLDMLSRKYEGAKKTVGDHLIQTLGNLGYAVNPELPQGNPVNFVDSALARYLSALFYQGQGNTDDARIEFNQSRAAFDGNSRIYNFPFPASVTAAQNVPEDFARLNIIAFTGLSPVKEERSFPVSFSLIMQNPQFYRAELKLPVLVERHSVIDRIEVDLHGYGYFDLELIEDIGAVAAETYNARFGDMFLKTYVRTLLKNVAADVAVTNAARQTARRVGDATGSLLSLTTGIFARVAVDASERADIRMGRFFPKKAHIGGINVVPGTYQVTVNFYQRDRIVASEDFRDVSVRAGELNMLQAFCLR